jgi:hypothetical protein
MSESSAVELFKVFACGWKAGLGIGSELSERVCHVAPSVPMKSDSDAMIPLTPRCLISPCAHRAVPNAGLGTKFQGGR